MENECKTVLVFTFTSFFIMHGPKPLVNLLANIWAFVSFILRYDNKIEPQVVKLLIFT